MTYQRLRERTTLGNYVIHLDSPGGNDYTLCGYAYEGACIGEGDSGVEPVARGKINCADCLRIFWFCRDVPKRIMVDPATDDAPIFSVSRGDPPTP